MAEESIRALSHSLPMIVRHPGTCRHEATRCMAPGSQASCSAMPRWACTTSSVTPSAGTFNLPHADVHTVILPHAIAYNRGFAPEAMHRVALALNADEAARGVYDLAVSLGARTSLAALGMPHDGLDRAADLAVQNQYPNPRPLERPAIRQLLEDVYNGTRP